MSNTRTAKQEALDAFQPKRAHLCAFDGCRVITIGEDFCYRHRPPPEPVGEWAISAAFKREVEDGR